MNRLQKKCFVAATVPLFYGDFARRPGIHASNKKIFMLEVVPETGGNRPL
jgi:hypothetical protein